MELSGTMLGPPLLASRPLSVPNYVLLDVFILPLLPITQYKHCGLIIADVQVQGRLAPLCLLVAITCAHVHDSQSDAVHITARASGA